MPDAPKGTVLAFDFGEARIGVAQGDAELGMTHPLATVTGNSNDEKFEAIGWTKGCLPYTRKACLLKLKYLAENKNPYLTK